MVGLRRINARHGWSRQNQPDRRKKPGRVESPPERRKQQKGKIGGCSHPMLASAAAGCCLFPSHAPSPARDCISTFRRAAEGFFFRGEYRLRNVLNNSIVLDTLAKLWETAQLPTWKWISVRHKPGHYRDTPFGYWHKREATHMDGAG